MLEMSSESTIGAAATVAVTANKIPALFVSHGSPMFALEPGTTGPALQQWARSLRGKFPSLRGVLVMSPHWMSPSIEVMSTPNPHTWHDFGGFSPALYRLQYPASGAPALAQRVGQLLKKAGMHVQLNDTRPFDHGAWVPLMHLLPKADVPVVQLSLPQQAQAADVYALGVALQSLRDEGVLLVGSGSMTHNLRDFMMGDGEQSAYVQEFSRWIEAQVVSGRIDALLNWQQSAPQALRAHPTDEHFLPLFFVLGAGGDNAQVEYLSREVMNDVLAMDSFALH